MGQISKQLEQIIDYSVFNKKNCNGENTLYPNQIQCAIDVLKNFDSDSDKTNHVVVKGFTQSGKTGVFTALINIIIKEKLSTILRVDKIIYLTGDNSRALPNQTRERILEQSMVEVDDNGNYNDLDGDDETIDVLEGDKVIPIYFIKNSYCKKCSIDLRNSMIFIDESHYGTTRANNSVVKLLEKNGINLQNDKSLSENHIYIISNSATPYKEIESDLISSKLYSILEPGEDYRGIMDFGEQVCVHSEHIMKNESEFINFMETEVYNHLLEIQQSSNLHKAVILRQSKKNSNLLTKLDSTKFSIKEVNSNDNSIDYNSIETAILNQHRGWKLGEETTFILIVIKGAYRMGISIPSNIKRLIGVVYDVTSSKDNFETTEQGLLGRMCGYYSDNEWKNIKFYLNKTHWEELYRYYTETPIEELCGVSPRHGIKTEKKQYIPCNKEEHTTIQAIIDNNGDDSYFIDYVIDTSYVEIESSKNYRKEFLESFVKEFYPNYIFLENRRLKKDSPKTLIQLSLRKEIIAKGHGYKNMLIEENVGKKCLNIIVDLRTQGKVIFKVKTGTIMYVKETIELENKPPKVTQTFNTSLAK